VKREGVQRRLAGTKIAIAAPPDEIVESDRDQACLSAA
jgi:hypothetical protein